MTIDGIGTGAVGPQKAHATRDLEQAQEEAQKASAEAPRRADRVEISEAGRNLLENQDIFESDPARVTQIRENIDQGLYNTPAVAEQVAVRLLSEVS